MYSTKDLVKLLRGEPGINRVIYFQPDPGSMFDFGSLKIWSRHGFMMLKPRLITPDYGASIIHDGTFIASSCGMYGIFHDGQTLTVDQILEGFFPKE